MEKNGKTFDNTSAHSRPTDFFISNLFVAFLAGKMMRRAEGCCCCCCRPSARVRAWWLSSSR